MTAAQPQRRQQTFGEEIANSISHGVALVGAMVAAAVLIISTSERGDPAQIVGASIFAATMLGVYGISALYHAWPDGKTKHMLRVLDHAAIFLLIAGTYTPFTLGVLRGGWGWSLLGIVWSLGLAGVVLKVLAGIRYPKLSLSLYLAMGWLVVIAAKPLLLSMQTWGLLWLLAGGLAYTGGVVFFACDRIRYSHFLWHLCVVAGTACHFVAVLRYAS